MPADWQVVSGRELLDAYEHQGSLKDFLPKAPAIYLWRRALRAPREALLSHDQFAAWLDATMKTPLAEIRDKRLSHFAVINRLTLHSDGFTATKTRHFNELMNTKTKRRWLARYVEQLEAFIPPVYCGETQDLQHRTQRHLAGDTGFGQRILDRDIDFSWTDLNLSYYGLAQLQPPTETRATEIRQLLELVTTAFSVAGYLSRRG